MNPGNDEAYTIYEFYSVDEAGRHEFLAIMPERRKVALRITRGSILKWGKMAVCDPFGLKEIYYLTKVIPKSRKRMAECIDLRFARVTPELMEEAL